MASTKSLDRPTSQPKSPLRGAVDVLFENDASLRHAITENLKGVGEKSKALTDRAKAAFANFNPSKLSTEESARRNYVAHGGDLAETQRAVIDKGVEAIRTSKIEPSITLKNSGDLKDLIAEATGEDESIVKTIELEPLINQISLKIIESPSPAYSLCKAELEAQKILDNIQAPAATPEDNGNSAVDNPLSESCTADQLVCETVDLQMKTATSPENELQYARIPNNADKDKVQSGLLQTFELRAGASDVTSYHDFTTLQIAFAHVWTEIFDGRLASLGRELYQEYVKLKEFTGSSGPDPTISTLDDLNNLMAEIKSLTQTVQDNTPTDFQAGGSSSTNNGSKGPGDKLLEKVGKIAAEGAVNPVGATADAIELLINAIENAGKKPQISWNDFPGPLPGHNDEIDVSFDQSAAPGTVQIRLLTTNQNLWKGIAFQEFDTAGNVVQSKISNNSSDSDLWDRNNPEHFNVLVLDTARVGKGVLEFDSQEGWLHPGRYLLGGLDEKLKDGTRVTFNWRVG